MIRAEALIKTYGDIVAVNDVSFEIRPQEIVGLLGHNGAGKTTIMRMITGCLEPSSGRITIDGWDALAERLKTQKGIGYLPENCPLYPEMTVLDYLNIQTSLRGVPDNKKPERIAYALEKTRLISVAQRQVGTLSRGYKQRVGVAQAIVNSPSILILDEPTNGLDPSQILEMRSLIRELGENATVVISTHILQEVEAVCGRVIIINNGKVALDAPMDRLQATGRILVKTDKEPESCLQIMKERSDLKLIDYERKQNEHCYTLEVDRKDVSEAVPVLAKTLVERGCKIYAIQPLVADLETIFGEITRGGEKLLAEMEGNGGSELSAIHTKVKTRVSPPSYKRDEGNAAENQEGDAIE